MIITGVASKIPGRIKHPVYVDAALPDPGESLYDLIRSAGIDPDSFSGLEPAPPYVEKLRFDPSKVLLLPKTYIRCTESEFSMVTEIVEKKIKVSGDN